MYHMNTKLSPVPGLWSRLLSACTDILFPSLCHGCKTFMPDAGELHICKACLSGSPFIVSPLCTVCGSPMLTAGGIDHICGSCLTEPPPFIAARSAVLFEGPVRELIHGFKYGRKVQHARPLGMLAAGALSPFAVEAGADLVVPVPLHMKRIRQRGFNQAILVGEILSRKWGLPFYRDGLCRTRWTEPQISLSVNERERNVRGAFAVKKDGIFKGKRVILVDDVYTTGSTVSECSRTLKRGGAEAIFVATIARAIT